MRVVCRLVTIPARTGIPKPATLATIYKHILPYLCWNGCTRIGEKTRLNVFLYGKYNGQVGEWLKPGDCKSPASGYVGSNPTLSTKFWADSDNGSTGRLQRFSRGSIPRRSTINVFNYVPVV